LSVAATNGYDILLDSTSMGAKTQRLTELLTRLVMVNHSNLASSGGGESTRTNGIMSTVIEEPEAHRLQQSTV